MRHPNLSAGQEWGTLESPEFTIWCHLLRQGCKRESSLKVQRTANSPTKTGESKDASIVSYRPVLRSPVRNLMDNRPSSVVLGSEHRLASREVQSQSRAMEVLKPM